MPHAATPTKLKNGTWGARVPVIDTPIYEGDSLQVTTKAGKSWIAIVDRIYFRGNGTVICSTSPARSRQRGHRRDDAIVHRTNGTTWIEY